MKNFKRIVPFIIGTMISISANANDVYGHNDIYGHFDGEFTHVGEVCATVRLIEHPLDVYAIDLSRFALIAVINHKADNNYLARVRLAKDVELPRRNTLRLKVWCAKDGSLEEKEFDTIADVWGTKP